MDKKVMRASAVSGLAGVVVGLILGRAIPQKIGVVEPLVQRVETAPILLSFYDYHGPFFDYFGINKVVNFADDSAPGMKAFAEYGGKKMELELWYYTSTIAAFKIPEELVKAKEFVVYAVDRHGNKFQPKTLFSSDAIFFEQRGRFVPDGV